VNFTRGNCLVVKHASRAHRCCKLRWKREFSLISLPEEGANGERRSMAVAAFLLWHTLKLRNDFKYFSSGGDTRLLFPTWRKNFLIVPSDVFKVKRR